MVTTDCLFKERRQVEIMTEALLADLTIPNESVEKVSNQRIAGKIMKQYITDATRKGCFQRSEIKKGEEVVEKRKRRDQKRRMEPRRKQRRYY